MRKIGQGSYEEQKSKRNVQIFCVILLGLMVFSSVGYAFFSNPNVGSSGQPSGNTGVTQYGDRWILGTADKPISLAFSPEETANTSFEMVLGLDNYISEPLFIDSQNLGATSELGGVFQYYSSRIQEACYGKCERDLPEKDCSSNIIIFNESIENKVRQEGKCIFINGDLRTVDAFVYRLLGISNS